MKKHFFVILTVCCYSAFSQTDSYNNAWKALNANNRAEAQKFLTASLDNPSFAQDAFITNLYLQVYNNRSGSVKDFFNSFYKKSTDPYPYMYALWFNKAVAGDYGKKTEDNQIQLVNALLKDPNAPGTLIAAANYQMGMNELFSANFDKAQDYYNEIGSIKNWQFTGPFENLSESGFYKDYGPLEHPEPDAVFKSVTNADVKWFTPAKEITDGYIPAIFQFRKNVAVVYAQSFVNAPSDEEVYCNAGCGGSLKIWINDELVMSQPRERVTEMDAYSTKCSLKKGNNRVLIQLGYTNLSYPNFVLRFTDDKMKPLPNITGSSVYSTYTKVNGGTKKYEMLPLFAEKYFKNKIQEQPDNLVNYLLLADTYLRNKKLIEARDIITSALKKAPDNCLLTIKLADILDKQNNHTLYLEEIEKIKFADPESAVVKQLKIKELYDNEKYDECTDELNKMIAQNGEDEFTDGYNLLLLSQQKKYDDLIKTMQRVYTKYPNNAQVLTMMYGIKKDVNKDNKGAMAVYEKFMKDNYDYNTYINYADILIDKGEAKKGIEIKKKLADIFPYDPGICYTLSKYYFSTKEYDKAEMYTGRCLALAPYSEVYWEQLGDIQNERKNTAEALKDYNQSLKFDPDQYDLINKIRKLNNKPEISKLFAETDIAKIIKEDNPADAKNTDYGYYYILDQRNSVVYPDGANEEYNTIIIRITNDKGVENYKESTIGYGNSQSLLIEKAEIIKKNQSKIEGERNDNQVVFTNLEVGDIIVFQYRIQNYHYGRFAKEYWDRYSFSGQIYSAATKYNLYMPADKQINYVFTNSPLQPVITAVEDFKEYSWIMNKPVPLKDEPLMPLNIDAGSVLHISTINSWKEIANWYSDITNNKSEEDFEIIDLCKKLFPDNKKLSQYAKAKIIYDYIEANIKYSMVSFRQSAFVPQRASEVVTTRLGDCKDLSGLFVTLAHMCGIPAQMVLVDTRNNGEKDMLLPSVDFNHCIVKTVLDNKNYFIELTDNYLPFTAFPNNDNGATALEIPDKQSNNDARLIHLKSDNRTKDITRRVMNIKPQDGDLLVESKVVKYGAVTSSLRENYVNLDNEKQKQDMQKTIAGSYKNNVTLQQLKFDNIDKISDSLNYSYTYKVKNEVAEIGSLNTFKITYPDIVASLDNFSEDTRQYPVEYWRYEDQDNYETIVNIDVPKGAKFTDLPKNETLIFKDMKFSLEYKLKAPDKLIVIRKFSNDRPQEILPQEYPDFKSFFEKIVKAEQKYIVYK